MGLFSSKLGGKITSWDGKSDRRMYGWSCGCGRSVSTFTERRSEAERALRTHMKIEHKI